MVYHDDERHGILQSRIIFEKGFDNIYLLSGGLCIFEKEFSDLIDPPKQFAVGSARRVQTAASQASLRQQQNTGRGRQAAAAATPAGERTSTNSPQPRLAVTNPAAGLHN